MLSGREFRMQVTEKSAVVTNRAANESDGLGLDVVPYVLADGYTINLAVIPSGRVSDGYYQLYSSNFLQSPTVLTNFAVRNLISTANVWDNQTLVLRLPEQFTNKDKKVSDASPDKELFIIITATIIDPAGNRVHSDDELPFAQNAVPSQPQSPSPPH
jgi:hypothetical protein